MAKVLVIGSIPFSLINFRKPLLLGLKSQGHEVLTAAGGNDAEFESALSALGFTYYPVTIERNSLSPVGAAKTLFSLYRLCKTVRPDVVFLYTIQPVLFGSLASWLVGTPRTYSMITGVGTLFDNQDAKSKVARAVISPIYRFALSRNKRLVYQNPHDRRDFIKWGLVKESAAFGMVPSSGVDPSIFSPSPVPRGDRIKFLYSARLMREKGIVDLLEAATILRDKGVDFELDIVGDGMGDSRLPDSEIDEMVARAGARRHGWVKDVREYIRQCHVFVLPSWREGAPRSVLEAMSMGRAIITTTGPGCIDVVRPDVNAKVAAPGSVDELVACMQGFIDNPELVHNYGAESIRIVEEEHVADVVALKTIEQLDLSDNSTV